MQKYILILGAGAWLIYSLLYRPRWIAILFFAVVIAEINFDVPGAPFNFRALLSLMLFAKVLSDSTKVPGPSFISTAYSKYIIGFILYVLTITYSNGLLTIEVIKEYIFALLTTYLAYYYYMKEGGYKIFKASIIIAGLICLGDLLWSYKLGVGLAIERIYYSFTPAWEYVNHNYFGYVCGIAFVFLLGDYLSPNKDTKWNLYLMPVMFFGVLLSTSRSSLLILIIVSVILIARGLMSREQGSKAYRLLVVSISCLIIAVFMFKMLAGLFNIDSGFMEQITARMIDEPLAIFNRAMGNDFEAESLDSADWRAEASEIAYHAFTKVLTPSEQLFGIGHDGFISRNLGFMGIYAAHNGILLMLIEFGVLGFVLYYVMLISLLAKTMKSYYFSPLAICIIFIFLFMISHNREMTSHFALLITGSLAGEIQYLIGDFDLEDTGETEEADDPTAASTATNNF